VSTCNETETVSSIMERMSAGKFRHMRDSAAMRDYIVTA
jgi:hypothetical protein